MLPYERQSFIPSKKKVYNLDLEDWHTYFVGKLTWLVYNAKALYKFI
jgi:hypothetical protein